MYQIITLYTINAYNCICNLSLDKDKKQNHYFLNKEKLMEVQTFCKAIYISKLVSLIFLNSDSVHKSSEIAII